MNGLLTGQAWHRRVADLLDDPIMQLLLRCDRLTADDVLRQLAPVAERLGRRPGTDDRWPDAA